MVQNYLPQASGFYFALPWFEIHMLCRKSRIYFLPWFCVLCFFVLATAVTCCSFVKWKRSNTTAYRWWKFKGFEQQLQNIVLDHSSLTLTDFFLEKIKRRSFTIDFSVIFVINFQQNQLPLVILLLSLLFASKIRIFFLNILISNSSLEMKSHYILLYYSVG